MQVFGGVCSMLIFNKGVIEDYTSGVTRSQDASQHEDDIFFWSSGSPTNQFP